jgi:hypothetical protein
MPGTFNDWVAGQGLGTEDGPGDDPDGDGVTNSLEAWLGTDPATPSNSFSAPSTDLTTTSFTHPRNMRAPTDLSASYEWSPNLVDWYPDAGGPIDGPTVSFSSSTLDGTATVTATASEEMPRLFLRVVVTQN